MKNHPVYQNIRLILTLLAFAMTAMAQTPVTPVTPVTPIEVTPVTPVPPPTAMPIGSYAQLKSYAAEQISFAQMGLWAPTYQSLPGEVNFVSGNRQEGESPFRFLERVLKSEFRFGLLDKRDRITVDASVFSKESDFLFWANESAWTYDKGNGAFGFSLELLRLHLADTVALPAGNITNASIYYRDEYGQFAWPLPLTIYQGKIYFPTKYAGREGQLVGLYPSGAGYSQVAYDLSKDGKQVRPVVVGGMVKGAIDNTFEFHVNKDFIDQNIWVSATAEGSRETPPVVRINVPNNGVQYRFHVSSQITRYGRKIGVPNRAMVRWEGGAPHGVDVQLQIDANGNSYLELLPGVYWLMLDNDEIYDDLRPAPSTDDIPIGDGKG
ncbi:MAG: hypothetical protein RIQ72_542 [Candidatus Parcubacteria bacterium]